jgi:hypothetical protein
MRIIEIDVRCVRNPRPSGSYGCPEVNYVKQPLRKPRLRTEMLPREGVFSFLRVAFQKSWEWMDLMDRWIDVSTEMQYWVVDPTTTNEWPSGSDEPICHLD